MKIKFTINKTRYPVQVTGEECRAAVLTVCMVLFAWCISFAQLKFVLKDTIPVTKFGNQLQLPWAGGINYPQWSEIDLNKDGKKDLFMFDRSDNRITILMNDGTSSPLAFHYDSNSVKYAAMFPKLNGWAFLYDYNGDGLPDIFTVDPSNSSILPYTASYSAGKWTFTQGSILMTEFFPGFFSNIGASAYLTPSFVDMDGDGDMDIVGHTFSCVGTIAYYRNYAMETMGNANSLDSFKTVTNSWGHFGLRSGLYCNTAQEYENIVCRPGQVAWDPADVIRRDDTYFCVTIMNLNGDSLMDALIGDAQAKNLLALYNTGTTLDADIKVADQDTLFPKYDKPVWQSSFNCPSYVDVNNDGVKDLLVGNREYEDRKGMWYYKNNGTNTYPNFSYQNDSLFQSMMIDAGEGASPVFFDADNDGLLDIIIGSIYTTDTACFSSNYKSGLTLYRNTGTATHPSFQFVTDDYAGLKALAYPLVSSPYHPTFGDVDGDGKRDMIVGGYDGRLMFFKNKAGVIAFPPDSIYYMQIDVGNCAMPQLVDLDKDGKLDLVIGESNGTLNFCRNTGTLTVPAFSQPVDSFGKVDVHTTGYTNGYSVPHVFKYNGEFKLLVSCMDGKVLLYDNIDTTNGAIFNIVDTVIQKNYGIKSSFGISVGGGDINGDHNEDMLLGLYGGGVQIFYGDFPLSIKEPPVSKIQVDVYPNPVSDVLNLNIHHRLQGNSYSLVIFNAIGDEVYARNVSWGNQSIDTKRFSNGIYLLQVRDDDQTLNVKVIVHH